MPLVDLLDSMKLIVCDQKHPFAVVNRDKDHLLKFRFESVEGQKQWLRQWKRSIEVEGSNFLRKVFNPTGIVGEHTYYSLLPF